MMRKKRPRSLVRVADGVYKRDDLYCTVVDYPRGTNCKRDQRWFGGFKTKTEAIEERDRRRREARSGIDVNPRRLRLFEYLDRWIAFKEAKAPALSPRTLALYRGVVEHRLKPTFGDVPLSKLTTMRIAETVSSWTSAPRADRRRGTLSQRSLQLSRLVLKMAMQQAARWHLISPELAASVEPQRVDRQDAAYVAADDLVTLFSAAEDAGIYAPVAVTLGLGLRRSELLGLQWRDVDFERGVVRVDRGLQRVDHKLVTAPPKTRLSRRSLVAPQFVLEALRVHRQAIGESRMRAGLGKILAETFVFCNPNGGALDPDSFSKRFRRVARGAGLLNLHLHSLRHGFAVLGLQAGIDLKTISASLGHSSIRLTADTYGHVVNSVQRDAADRMDALVKRSRNSAS